MSVSPKVLVVEDEALIRFSTAEGLSEADFIILSARNADEAITLLEAHSDIAIIFTDIDMPGSMDGLQLAGAVRDRWPPVKIVVTSGKTSPQVSEMPFGASFVPKPYEVDAVSAAFRALMAA